MGSENERILAQFASLGDAGDLQDPAVVEAVQPLVIKMAEQEKAKVDSLNRDQA